MDETLKTILIIIGILVIAGLVITMLASFILGSFIFKRTKKIAEHVDREFDRHDARFRQLNKPDSFDDHFDTYFRDERKK